MKKNKKKRKLKKGCIVFLMLVIILFLLYFIIKETVGLNIKNIYIYNNNFLSDQEIIELGKIENYPNFYTTTAYSIKKNIKKNDLVKDVKVTKGFFQKINIYVTEYKILFLYSTNNEYVLENGDVIKKEKEYVSVPILINYVPNEKYKILLKRLNKIDSKILKKVSEIKYDPNEVDEDRFLLYMNDQNYVYLTLTKFEILNKYDETVKKLEGKKGILYLDSGNYFQIKQ